MRAPDDEVEFISTQPAAVITRMQSAALTRDCWVNLRPIVDEERLPAPGFSLFAPRTPVLPLGTWVPGEQRRGRIGPTSIGLQHPAGRRVVPELIEAGIAPPGSWRQLADHPRRGVVFEANDDDGPALVLDWLLRAMTHLSPVELDGEFRASFHPR